ncbi:SDR family NAD(P)-dependent oxidoreductase [Actinomyces sp. 2119]|uniref:SDR family NAD(P)-dependent oxidoreductase n=1 Tax=Actinomyces sp. 2119 TaxID=2321393 RepID=UPI000E6D226E|nr:SDR family NAD(P)-dependent oxidoreductase [Actinomyces sp. 2119]RJF41179.1 SDR family NAD(P)-dependent oxidoreductase [Actinomyces sp. 2119]
MTGEAVADTAGVGRQRQILQAVRDGRMSSRAAAAALKALYSDAPARQDVLHSTTSVGWFSPRWQASPPAPAAPGNRTSVIVAGLDHRPERLGGGYHVVDPPLLDTGSGGGYGVLAWARWWSEALGAAPLTDPGHRCLVVLDGSRLHGSESIACAAGLVRTLCVDGGQADNQVVWVCSGPGWSVRACAVAAYGQIARAEEGRLSWTSVGVGEHVGDDEAVRVAERELGTASPGSAEVRYVDGHRTVKVLEETACPEPRPAEEVFRDESTWLVSGGAGGLGRLVSADLARRCRARLVLVGRRPADQGVLDFCQDLEALGGRAFYARADMTDPDAVRCAVEEAVQRFGPLRNVLHLAGSSSASLVRSVDDDVLRRSWAAKAEGAVTLDEATRDQPLERFVLFSSSSAYLGAPGQAPYAAVSRALGELAHLREEEVRAGRRQGRTQSLIWPFWEDGGMPLDDWNRDHLREVTGLVPLRTQSGLDAMEAALASPVVEPCPVVGDLTRFREFLHTHLGTAVTTAPSPRGSGVPQEGAGSGDAVSWLVGLVEQTGRFPKGAVDPDTPFELLGVDSLMVRRLGAAMEPRLGPQPASLFYEHRSIRSLAEQLSADHPDAFGGVSSPGTLADTATVQEQRHGASEEGIAIIGMAGRFPGAQDIDELWAHLLAGSDLVTEVPDDRWDADRWYSPRPGTPGRTNSRWGGFLEGVADFDPLFFGMSPREATLIDPQERLFLETAWHALEDAACSPSMLRSCSRVEGEHRVGVFAAVTSGQYQLLGIEQWGRGQMTSPTSSYWSVANRVSYLLDLHGPSMTIDTACSSSLVALHEACESIRRGESMVAITGGVNLSLHPAKYVALAQHRFLSSDGRCRAFGEGGDGYVPGEGAVVLVLKPLAAARRDGDPVRAVIRSTAVNHGGRTNGYTVPGPGAQSAVVSQALDRAGVDRAAVSYVEAHGTGTALGDPIEIEGLERAFAREAGPHGCAIGSVKSNIGHLEAAAGVAGVVKCVLQMQHCTLVPTLHCEPASTSIDWARSPFRPQRGVEPWRSPDDGPLLATVSSFGAGGTNACLVLESPEEDAEPGSESPQGAEVVLLSARTETDLRRLALRLRDNLAGRAARLRLPDVAWTLGAGRESLAVRAAVRAETISVLLDRLAQLADGAELGREHQVRALAGDPRAAAVDSWLGGATPDLSSLFDDGARARRIHLPGYPFQGERYWVGEDLPVRGTATPGPGEGRRVTYHPEDTLVAQHRVRGQRVVPAAAHLLAMVDTAGTGAWAVERLQLRSPLLLAEDGPSQVMVAAMDDGRLQITSAATSGAATVHAVGRVVPAALPQGDVPDLLDRARGRCSRVLEPETIYAQADRQGLHLGPVYQGVTEFRVSEDGDEALATVMPRVGSDPAGPDSTWWMPAPWLDSMMHPLLALAQDGAAPLVPQAVERVTLSRRPHGAASVHARVRSRLHGDRGALCDVTVSDSEGLCVAFEGLLAVRIPEVSGGGGRGWEDSGDVASDQCSRSAPGPSTSRLLVPCLFPRWVVCDATGAEPAGRAVVLTVEEDFGLGDVLTRHHRAGLAARLVLRESESLGRADLDQLVAGVRPGDTVYLLTGLARRRYAGDDPEDAMACQDHTVLLMVRLCQALTEMPGRGRGIRLVVVTNDVQQLDAETAWNPFAGGLLGLTRVAASELPGVVFASVDVSATDLSSAGGAASVASTVARLSPVASGDEHVVCAGVLLRKQYDAAVMPAGYRASEVFSTGGTYLVVGGAGGLGMAVAQMLVEQCLAQVYLVGRRPVEALAPAVRAALDASPRLVYVQGDVTNESDMRSAVELAAGAGRRLDGVIHAAFVMGDGVIAGLTQKDLSKVMAPKVAGAVALHRALWDVEVDRLVFFSSAVSFTGARGQGAYAAASSFMDTYARYLAARWGRQVSVLDWGFWGEVGAVATEEYRARMADQGVAGLTTAEGLAALTAAVGTRLRQVAPFRAASLTPRWQVGLGSDSGSRSALSKDLARFMHEVEPLDDADALDELEEVAHRALVVHTDLLGIPDEGEEPEQTAQRLRVVAAYRPLLDAVIDILVRRGYVEAGADGVLRVTDRGRRTRSAAEPLQLALDRLQSRRPGTAAYVTLVDRCTRALLDVLAGTVRGNAVLFPAGSDRLVAAVYQGNRRADYFSSVVVEAVRSLVTRTRRPLRLIEVGAGTGGTTDHLLDGLVDVAASVERYDVTDISPALARGAASRYRNHLVDVTTGVLDIERPPADQGYSSGSYDVVVATNVLHATRDMATTLAHTAELLRPGGILLVNEATRVRDFMTLVFGLTDGWWLATDRELRIPYSPLLEPGAWRAAAVGAGFARIELVGVQDKVGTMEEAMGQMVLVAERGPWLALDPEHPARLLGGGDPSWEEDMSGSDRLTDEPASDRTASPPVPVPASAPSQAAPQALVDELGEVYAVVLGLRGEKIDPHQRLSAYGCDSVASLEVLDRLEERFGAIAPEAVLGAETLAGLATALSAEFAPSALDEDRPGDDTLGDADGPGPGLGSLVLGSADTRAVPSPVPGKRRPALGSEAGTGDVVSEIAVIGMAGRYPAAKGLSQWWQNLLAGRRTIGPVPASRWSADVLSEHPSARWGGFLEGIDQFDSLLLGISPREAAAMDPQARLLLENVWELLDDAGYPRSRANAVSHAARAAGVGTFVGAMDNPYEALVAQEWGRGNQVLAGSGSWGIANRVSFAFGFDGPSITVDSACSSSATAIHLACESLRRGECGMAVVGGVNLILHPGHHLGLAQGGMLSEDGRPQPFSETADGTVTSEGVGSLLLRPLADALRDGDRVLGCVLASTMASNGARESYLSPSAAAEAAQLRATLRAAGASPRDIGYVEAQAMGSRLGDEAEASALRAVIGGASDADCRVGTMKGLLGHLEAASGVAQVTKVLLQMQHGTIAPSVEAHDPFLHDPDARLRVVTEQEPWSRPRPGRCLALVDSFGAGGANTQLLLSEPPARPVTTATRLQVGQLPFLLSARRPAQLQQVVERLVDALADPAAEHEPQDVAYTLFCGREPLSHRLAVVATGLRELQTALRSWLAEPAQEVPGLYSAAAPGPPGALLSPAEEAASLWIRGETPQWESLGVTGARMTTLPSYPFAPVRHWFQAVAASAPESVSLDQPEEAEAVSHPVPSPPVASESSDGPTDKDWSRPVRAALADVLQIGLDEIEDTDSISDFGLDSVSVVALTDLLRSEHGASLMASDFYEARTVADLADLVRGWRERPDEARRDRPGPAQTHVAARVAGCSSAQPEEGLVAIIGMSARLPGGRDVAGYWRATLAGRVETQSLPAWRCGAAPGGSPGAGLHLGTFIDAVDEFDARFFGISPREARLMDPQHRLFLQTVWHTIEDAGYDPAGLAGSPTGIFVGVAGTEYGQLLQSQGADSDGQLVTGNVHSVLANRISFLLDLRGPSEPVDTACSSSLVAVHRAVRAIRSGECAMAVAGGVNVLLTTSGFEAFASSGMLAPDGRCKTFDSRADGYVRGEGVGAVLLKPLRAAQEDGDHVYAVIRGTAVGHGGRAASLSAPQPASQADVIVRAWEEAGVQEGPQYIEAHGTGTRLGDPVEVSGLTMAAERLRAGGMRMGRCGLSTGKTGIGHLETAAGIAGLVRAVLALQHRIIPPLAGLQRVNELIDLSGTPFTLVAEPQCWEAPTGQDRSPAPRRAGVSSFGFGGVNAHVALEEAPLAPALGPVSAGPSDNVVVISGRDERELRETVLALADLLGPVGSGRDLALHDVAFTLQEGRAEYDHRLAVVAADVSSLARRLYGWLEGQTHESVRHGTLETVRADGEENGEEAGQAPSEEPLTSSVLADRWVCGRHVNWDLGRRAGSRRVSLPGHAFARDSHWLVQGAAALPAPVAPSDQGTGASATLSRGDGGQGPAPVLVEESPVLARDASDPQSAGEVESPAGGRADLVRQFRRIIVDHLETPLEAVSEADDLRDLGLDSIAGLRIMQVVQAQFGKDISMLSIIEHPTIEGFVDMVLLPRCEDTTIPPGVTVPVPEAAAVGSGPRSADTTKEPVAPVYRLAAGQDPDGPRLFCLPGETGELTWALALLEDESGRMLSGGSVLGVESSTFRSGPDDAQPSRTIAVRADECVRSIITETGEAPVRLMASGRAAVLGIEVTRRLADAGVQVAELVLAEPLVEPEAETTGENDLAAVVRSLARDWQVDLGRLAEGQVADISQALSTGRCGMGPESIALWVERAAWERGSLVTAVANWPIPPLVGAAATVTVWGSATGLERLVVPPPREEPAPRRSRVSSLPTAPPVSAVPINPRGELRPSFWCHSLLGDVSYALHLSQNLGGAHPLFGLEQFHLDGSARTFDCLEDLAASHILAMREVDPTGPYRIGGYSMGGILAFECARQLVETGAEVRSLALIDPIMPNTAAWHAIETENIEDYDFDLVALVLIANALGERWEVQGRISHGQLTGMEPQARTEIVSRYLHAGASKERTLEEVRDLVKANHRVITQNNAALERYLPRALGTRVPTLMLRASQGQVGPDNPNQMPVVGRLREDPSNGLAPYLGGALTIKDVDADHFTICDQQHIAEVARAVKSFWLR